MTQDSSLSIYSVFKETANRLPNKTALICKDRQLDYQTLDRRVDALASYLESLGVEDNDIIGIYAQRDIETIIAILAVLRLGAAYLPFDPAYPNKLLKSIYADGSPKLMLVQTSLANNNQLSPFWNGKAIDIAVSCADKTPTSPLPQADQTAYVMYTSGSTGQPKGVVVPHRGILRLVHDTQHYASFSSEHVFLQLAPLAFDASTFEIWGALLNGATLAIAPETVPSIDNIVDTINQHQVTTLWLTAGLFHLIVEHRLEDLKSLTQLLAGGDVLSPDKVVKAIKMLPNCQLINGYGPTENTTFTCCYRFPKDYDGSYAAPIGKAINDTTALILDNDMQPVADGSEGELYTGGKGLASGYLNLPEATTNSFVSNPFEPNSRLYKTGDRVRLRADGNIEFCGRVDRQVKISGKRVEVGEIELCIRNHHDISDAIVLVSKNEQKQLHAFITTTKAPEKYDLQALRKHLNESLPSYMVPPQIHIKASFPLTANGKVDHAALFCDQDHRTEQKSVNSRTIEQKIQALWQDVLGRSHIDSNDNFFDIGGTSMQLIEIQARLKSELDQQLDIVDLFSHPSINSLAARLNNTSTTENKNKNIKDKRKHGRSAALKRARLKSRN